MAERVLDGAPEIRACQQGKPARCLHAASVVSRYCGIRSRARQDSPQLSRLPATLLTVAAENSPALAELRVKNTTGGRGAPSAFCREGGSREQELSKFWHGSRIPDHPSLLALPAAPVSSAMIIKTWRRILRLLSKTAETPKDRS